MKYKLLINYIVIIIIVSILYYLQIDEMKYKEKMLTLYNKNKYT